MNVEPAIHVLLVEDNPTDVLLTEKRNRQPPLLRPER